MTARLTLRKGLLHLALAFLLTSCGEADTAGASFKDDPVPQSDATLVYSVSDVQVVMLESAPLQIQINASGQTRTGGWHDAALVLDEEASAGPLLVYNFVAVRPTGMATQAFAPVEASARFGPWLDRMAREIRVVAETNQQTIYYPSRNGSE